MATAIYTGEASQLFKTLQQAKQLMEDLQKIKTEMKISAKLQPGTLTELRGSVHKGAELIGKSAFVEVRVKPVGMAEAAKRIKEAFSKEIQCKIAPYVTTASMNAVKDRIREGLKITAVEVGLRFQTGAAGKFRDTVKKLLRIISNSSYIDAEIRLKKLELDKLKNRKVEIDVDVKVGSAAKIKALLALLKTLRDGAKIPVKLEIAPGLESLLKQLAGSLKTAADQASRLNQRLGASVGAQKKLTGAARETTGPMARIGEIMAGFAGSQLVLSGISAIFAGLKDALWDFPVKLQEIQVGFDRMLGSPEKGKVMLESLKQFGIPTPFQTQDLARNAQQSMAFGLINKKSKTVNSDAASLMRDVGDASFGLGRGQEGVDRMLLALGQMNVAQRVTARQMMQLQQVGVNAWGYLATATGKSTKEVRALVSAGLIPADKAIKAIREGLRGDFGGSMEKASKTVVGSLHIIQDELRVRLSQNFSKQFQEISDALVKAAHYLGTADFGHKLDEIGAYAQKTIDRVGTAYRFLADLYTHNSGIINTGLILVGTRLLWLQAVARGGPFGALLSFASMLGLLSERTDGVGRAAKILQPVLYGLAAAYVALRIAATAAGAAQAFQAGMAGRAAAVEGLGAAATSASAAMNALGGVLGTFKNLSSSMGAMSALRAMIMGIGSDAALIGPEVEGAGVGIAGIGGSALIAGPLLVALAAAIGVVAIGYEAYQAKAARVSAANADLDYSTKNVKKAFDSLQQIGNITPGKTDEIKKLRDEYEQLGGTIQGLSKVGADVQLTRAHVEVDTKLKPLDRAVLLDELNKVQRQLDAQKQALEFKVKCDAEANPTSLANLRKAFSDTYSQLYNLWYSIFAKPFVTQFDNTVAIIGGIWKGGWNFIVGVTQSASDKIQSISDSWKGTLFGRFLDAETEQFRTWANAIVGYVSWLKGELATFRNWLTGQSANPNDNDPGLPATPGMGVSRKPGDFAKGGAGKTSASDPYGDPGAPDKRTPNQRIAANPNAFSPAQRRAALIQTQTPSAAAITPFAPDAGKEKKHRKTDAERAAEKAEREAKRRAHQEQMAQLKEEKGALENSATAYEQHAKAVADAAKLQLTALEKLRDGFSSVFSDIQSHLVSLGVIDDPLGPTIRMFEKLLDIGGKSAGVVANATAQITRLHGAALSARSQKEKLEGLDGNVPDGDGGLVSSSGGVAATSAAGAKVANHILELHRKGIAASFVHQCEGLAHSNYDEAGVHTYDNIFAGAGSALGAMHRFQNAGIGQRFVPGMPMSPGGLLYSDTMGHGSGHVQTVGSDGARYDQYGRDKFKESNFEWYVPPPGARTVSGGSPGSISGGGAAKSGGKIGHLLQRDAFKQGDDSLDALIGLDGSMSKIAAIDKSWGKAVENINGNSMRFAIQTKIASKEFQTQIAQAARETGRTAPDIINWLRQVANYADSLANRAKALSEVRKGIAELGKSARKIEKKDNPLVEAEFDFQGGGKYADAPEKRKSVYDATMAVVLAKTREETDKATDAETKRAGALKLAAPFLNAAIAGTDAYQMALERANKKFAVWNSDTIKGLLDAAKTYKQLGDEAEKTAQKLALPKNVQGPQSKAYVDAKKLADGWHKSQHGLERQANLAANAQIGAGYGADAADGQAAIKRLGLEADFGAKQDGYLADAERRILLNEKLNAREKALDIAKLKWTHDKDIELRKSADFAKAYTNKAGVVDTTALIAGADTESKRQAENIDFTSAIQSEDITAYSTALLDANKASATFGDTTGLAAQKFDLANGALSTLTNTQKAQILVTQADIEGLKKYEAEYNALFSQQFALQAENDKARILLQKGGLSPRDEQELKWKEEDAQMNVRLIGLTKEQRDAYDAQRPAIEALRQSVRGYLGDTERLAAADWFKNQARGIRDLLGNQNLKGKRSLDDDTEKAHLTESLAKSGITDTKIVKVILETSQLQKDATDAFEKMRTFTGSVDHLFSDGFQSAFEHGPGSFFTSVSRGAANMMLDLSRQLVSSMLTKLFMKAFPSVAGWMGKAQTEQERLTQSTLAGSRAGQQLAATYEKMTAALKKYMDVAQGAPAISVPMAGGSGSFGSVFGGLIAGGRGLFGGSKPAVSSALPSTGGIAGSITPSIFGNVGDFLSKGFSLHSHRLGLDYVPYDGYKMIAHAGEAVLNARDADMFRASTVATPSGREMRDGGDVHHNYNVTVNLPSSMRNPHEVGPAIERHLETVSRRSKQQNANDAIAPGSRQR